MSHEIFLYCFDATLMYLNMIVFIFQDIGTDYVAFRYFNYESPASIITSRSIETDKETMIESIAFFY